MDNPNLPDPTTNHVAAVTSRIIRAGYDAEVPGLSGEVMKDLPRLAWEKSITFTNEKPSDGALVPWGPGPMRKIIFKSSTNVATALTAPGVFTMITNTGVGTLVTSGRDKGSIRFDWTNEIGKVVNEFMTNRVGKVLAKTDDDSNLPSIESITLDEARRILQDLVALTGKKGALAVKP